MIYYNENNPNAVAWLRRLIEMGEIPDGFVDDRSILDVCPEDLQGYTQCHFFAGVAGWPLALNLAGWSPSRPVWTGSPPCQPFSIAGDMKGQNDARHLAPHFIELVGACRPRMLFGEQVASAAVFGKASGPAGDEDPTTPDWAWLDDLSDRLEGARYAVGAKDYSSADVGAPHIRQRTFFGAVDLEGLADQHLLRLEPEARDGLRDPQHHAEPRGNTLGLADRDDAGRQGRVCRGSDPERENLGGHAGRGRPAGHPWQELEWVECRDDSYRPVEPEIFGLADGVPAELVHSGAYVPASSPLAPKQKDNLRTSRRVMRLHGYGNAINPWAAKEFIEAFDDSVKELTW